MNSRTNTYQPQPSFVRNLRPALWLRTLSRMLGAGFGMLLLPFVSVVFVNCTGEASLEDEVSGGLQLSLSGISAEVSPTRTTPADLGKPSPADFHLNIVRQSNGVTIYDAAFTDQKIKAAPDSYSITATFGTNPILGLDDPYYIGTTTATVESTTEATPVSLPVKIGNALVSAVFNDTARFNRFYDSYSVVVQVGSNSAAITNENLSKSVYVRAGSTVELSFTGYLKALGQQVSMPLQLPEGVSNTLQAADHLIFTLALEPNAESAVVNVVKAELEKADVEEKISYNWLPAPVVHTEHKYVRSELVGTDVSIDASFPGTTWEATIHQGSASGNVVRVFQGQGALSSSYQENAAWPYLPPGHYVATYRYYSKQGQAYNFSKTTEFTVPNANLTLTADAYTAHSKYEEGDIDAANACERLTVYKPSVQWNVAASLLANENYTKTYTTSIAGKTKTVTATRNNMTLDNITEVPVSGNLYTLTITANFGGQTVAATKQVRITGLPVEFAPPKSSEWTRSGSGSWQSGYTVLGNRGGLLTESDETLTNTSSVNIPAGTHFCMGYNIVIHPATIGTTFSVSCNSHIIFTQRQDGGALNSDDYPFQGTTDIFQYSDVITQLQCKNSYGGGQTCTNIYSLTFKYGQ